MGKLTKTLTGGGIVGSFLGNLFKSPDAAPAQPAPAVMPEAPDSNDETVRANKRKKAAQLQRSGRMSTMLSDGGADTLG